MPQAMKLLNEECMSEQKFINEDVQGVKHMYIVGPFLQSCERNRNGRVYPKHLIEREVNTYQKLIESREALGELSHPDSGEINPDRAAILITDLHMDENLAIGKARVLSTPCGKILESLLNDGVRMGVSSRGTGDLGPDNVVCENFKLICIDAVYMPSAQCAYSDAIYESVKNTTKWVLDESTNLYIEKKIEISEAADKFIKKIDKSGSKAIVNAFKDFFNSL